MDNNAKREEQRDLDSPVGVPDTGAAIETTPDSSAAHPSYPVKYHILAGMVLGLVAAAASLMFNIVGALIMGKHPLELIRVFLTFPLGEKALEQDTGFILATGCCLFLGTGLLGGIPFHLILSRYFSGASIRFRIVVATALSIGVWLITFYGLIDSLQPRLFGGRWIVEQIPIVVAVLTHLVFGWTILLLDQWAQFVPRPRTTGEASR